jgi:hypothetical protein
MSDSLPHLFAAAAALDVAAPSPPLRARLHSARARLGAATGCDDLLIDRSIESDERLAIAFAALGVFDVDGGGGPLLSM